MEKYQFSPSNDLQKSNETGVLRLFNPNDFGSPEAPSRIEALEHNIVNYFKTRDEDNNRANIGNQPRPNIDRKPFVAGKTQPGRKRGGHVSKIISGVRHGVRGVHMWSSGPAGTHVDDHDPWWDQCTCQGEHHSDNHECPCSHHYTHDEYCGDPDEHEDC